MPEIVKIDIVDELREMARLMKKGHFAASAYDAEFIVEAAAREIEQLRVRVHLLIQQKARWRELALADQELDPEDTL
jgi:hypothetical protein